ncbi:MAG: peptidoglycan editing factor PgeF [Thermodesulfovibrionales bacterium]|nr:peptidoglycan editing factor PgeF [Thermodesulfovibrionales bacterium]
MNDLIVPEIFPENIKAFFTTKESHDHIYQLSYPVYKPIQRHTSEVIILDGMERRVADGVITDRKGIVLGVETADCLPILLCDPSIPAVGAVHAGWRGTAQGIIKNAIKKFKEVFSSDPSRILMATGPSIGPCCYEVEQSVMEAVSSQTGSFYTERKGKYYIDLVMENIIQAVSEGLKRENIWHSGECTRCSNERFYSYRYHGKLAGRQGGFILIEI